MAIVTWYKHYGETLKDTLSRFRAHSPEYMDSKVTYAGRLDPLAEGVMILLTDEDTHRKDDFLGLDKIYEVEFILGCSSDTYDMLGIIEKITLFSPPQNEEVKSSIESIQGIHHQLYPPYSSKTVHGKPLWQYARENKLHTIDIPKEERTIYEAHYLGSKNISQKNFKEQYLSVVDSLEGDFRQEEIKESWNQYLDGLEFERYTIYKARFHVSSGTYIRSLIHHLGEKEGWGALCLKISRTQIGSFV